MSGTDWDDTMYSCKEELNYIVGHPSHSLAKPLPSSVWRRYYLKQAEALVAVLNAGTSSRSPRREFVTLAEEIRENAIYPGGKADIARAVAAVLQQSSKPWTSKFNSPRFIEHATSTTRSKPEWWDGEWARRLSDGTVVPAFS